MFWNALKIIGIVVPLLLCVFCRRAAFLWYKRLKRRRAVQAWWGRELDHEALVARVLRRAEAWRRHRAADADLETHDEIATSDGRHWIVGGTPAVVEGLLLAEVQPL